MTLSQRLHRKYDAWKDAHQRYPCWKVILMELPLVKIMFDSEAQHIYVRPDDDVDFTVAQAVAHLDLGHHQMDAGMLTAEHVSDATTLAQINIDDPKHRKQLDDSSSHVT